LDGYHFARQQCKETLNETADEQEKGIPRYLTVLGPAKDIELLRGKFNLFCASAEALDSSLLMITAQKIR